MIEDCEGCGCGGESLSNAGIGIQGPSGPQGIQGTQGLIGAQGLTGYQGVQGISVQGTNGAQGIAGSQGVQGFIGSVGIQGAVGLQGTQGIQGVQGRLGIQGYEGLQGTQGTQGIQGLIGAGLNILGSVPDSSGLPGFPSSYGGNMGDGYITENDGHLWVWSGTTWIDAGNITGPQGTQGITGIQGLQGLQGLQGTQGLEGLQGLQGLQGIQGLQGLLGVQGTQGVQGMQGVQGTQGIQGLIGLQGAIGNTGIQGTTGSDGIQGVQGIQGLVGNQGVQGTVGNTGSQGIAGIQGITGIQGVQGNVGTQGIQGLQGISGLQGIQGPGFNAVTSPADNRVLTSDGTTTGAIAESNLTFDGLVLDVNGQATADSFQVDLTPSTPVTDGIGKMVWNETEGTIQFKLKGGNVTLQIGTEQVTQIHNNTGSTLTDGQVVYINGSTGELPTVALASNAAEGTSATTLGVVTEPIANGASGFINTSGLVHGLNTLAFTEGLPIWLAATPGTFTQTEPIAPAHRTLIGYVVKRAGGNGSIYVKIQNGQEYRELSDVANYDPLTLANGSIAVWNSTTKLWVPTVGPVGPQGVQGVQGLTGIQGIQGLIGIQGIQGIAGLQGTTGSQGIQGMQGIQGIIGNTGSQGAIGSTGAQGAVGSQGTTGTAGSQGTTGSTGAQGTAGIQGAIGTAGSQGTTGLQGSVGIQGVQGLLGTQGITGTSGTQGTTGSQGIQGITGSQGTTGSDGVQGIQGIQGTTGVSPGGTTNYVPKFTGATTIGDSQLYDDGTSVGLNTTALQSKFHIYLNDAPSFNAVTGYNAVKLEYDGGFSEDDFGAGLTFFQKWFSGTALKVATGGIFGVKTNADGNYGGGLAFFYTPLGSSTMSEGARLNSAGYFALGTITPLAKFHTAINDNTFAGTGIFENTNTGTSALAVASFKTANNAGTFTIGQSNNGGGALIYNGANAPITFSTNASTRMTIAAGGSVGIGTTSPITKFHLYNGSIFVENGNIETTGYFVLAQQFYDSTYSAGNPNQLLLSNSVGTVWSDIKTVNGNSLIGSGDLTVTATSTVKKIAVQTADGTLVSSSTANTISGSILIPANTFPTNCVMDLSFMTERPVTGSITTTCRVYLNTSNSLTGATLLMTGQITGTNVTGRHIRQLTKVGNTFKIASTTTLITSDLSYAASALTSFTLATNQDLYLLIAMQNGNTTATSRSSYASLISYE